MDARHAGGLHNTLDAGNRSPGEHSDGEHFCMVEVQTEHVLPLRQVTEPAFPPAHGMAQIIPPDWHRLFHTVPADPVSISVEQLHADHTCRCVRIECQLPAGVEIDRLESHLPDLFERLSERR